MCVCVCSSKIWSLAVQPGCAKGRVVELSMETCSIKISWQYGNVLHRGPKFVFSMYDLRYRKVLLWVNQSCTHAHIHTYTETLLSSTCAGILKSEIILIYIFYFVRNTLTSGCRTDTDAKFYSER